MVKRKAFLIGPLVLLSCLATPSGAAPPQKFKTTVTLEVEMGVRAQTSARGTFDWHGRVKSANDSCKNKRVVTLYTIPEGGGKPVIRGTDTTGKNGKYSVIVDANYDGEYYAEAAKRTLGSGKVCKPGRSKSLFRDVMP